jgi:hypothetical protein
VAEVHTVGAGERNPGAHAGKLLEQAQDRLGTVSKAMKSAAVLTSTSSWRRWKSRIAAALTP